MRGMFANGRRSAGRRQRRWISTAWCFSVALVLGALGILALGTSVGGTRGLKRRASVGAVKVTRIAHQSPPSPRIVFGIYPGGAVGTVGPSGPVAPENPAQRLAALRRLRSPGRQFVVRLYVSYTAANGPSAEQQLGGQIEQYGQAGFQTELVIAYRPADGGSVDAVRGFVEFIRQTVRGLSPVPGFVSLQVTNEANQGGSPNTSDGYYAGAEDALIQGVIGAKLEIHQDRSRRIQVGFNWAYASDAAQRPFWSYLGRHGGRRFTDEVDWVGLDVYPGTWGPALGQGRLEAATTSYMEAALRRLRQTYMPLAGIRRAVPLRVAETGYPTGPGRTEAMQMAVLRAGIDAVYRVRRTYNVDGYRWFDLRDADSSSSSFQQQYGLLSDAYAPKPAFNVYRALVASLSR